MTTSPEPPLRIPLVDPRTGLLAREWAAFFRTVFTRTGGVSGGVPAITALQQALGDVQTELAMLPDQTAAVSTLAAAVAVLQQAVNDILVSIAMQPDPTAHLGAIQERIRSLEIMQALS